MVEKPLCPVCGKAGMAVKNTTIKHLVYNDLIRNPGEGEHYLCTSAGCDVVYYQAGSTNIFLQADVKVPVWFKEGASPKYICYCNMVTEDQIIDAAVNQNAGSLSDLVRLTGVMKNGQCLTKNPTGRCCSTVINNLLADLKKRGRA